MNQATLLIVLFFSSSTYAQIPWAGPCPKIPPFSGTWYEASKYFFFPELTGSCISVNYTEIADGTLNTQLRFTESITGLQMVYPGSTMLVDAASDNDYRTGNLQWTVAILNPFFPQVGVQKNYNFKIVAIDYDNWMIQWACFNVMAVHFKSVWVLSRDKSYPSEVHAAVNRKLDSLGINKDILCRTNQHCGPDKNQQGWAMPMVPGNNNQGWTSGTSGSGNQGWSSDKQ